MSQEDHTRSWSKALRRRRQGTDSLHILADLVKLVSLWEHLIQVQPIRYPLLAAWSRAEDLQGGDWALRDSHAPLFGSQRHVSYCLTAWCLLNTVLSNACWSSWCVGLLSKAQPKRSGIFSILCSWGQACDSGGASQETLHKTPIGSRYRALHGIPILLVLLICQIPNTEVAATRLQ